MYINTVHHTSARLRPASRRARPAGDNNNDTSFAEEVEVVLSKDALAGVDPDHNQRQQQEDQQASSEQQLHEEMLQREEQERVLAQLAQAEQSDSDKTVKGGLNITA